MSQSALCILKKLKRTHHRLGQIGLLLILSMTIALWGANNNVTADMLFQSPASPPPAEDGGNGAPPPPEPAPESAPAEQPAPDEPAPAPSPEEQPPLPEPAPEFSEPPASEERNFPPAANPEPTASRNFILDQVEMIDAVVVSGAYIWLCCGVGFFLLIPIFLSVIYIRGRSKLQKQEDMFG